MTLMFPKSPPLRDRKYLDAVREMPCILSGLVPSDPAHIRFGGGGGMGMKPPDNHVLPLAPHLHREQHQIGERAFWLDAMANHHGLLEMALIALAEKVHREWQSK
jgi:hypothetical protein